MVKKLPTRPGAADRAVQFTGDRAGSMPGNVLDENLFFFLSQLLAVVAEQREQIETLRVALNEARTDPTTAYPAVPEF